MCRQVVKIMCRLTANNKITLEWEAVKKEDKFKYQYKASNTSKDADWTAIKEIENGDNKTRKIEITSDSNNQPLTNKTKVEYKIYNSNDQLVASGIATAKVGKDAITGGEDGTEISGITTGKVLTIEGKEYTVIENVEGSKYKVLATDFANNGRDMKFDDNRSNNYATSTIANYLDNDYYNSLPENTRNAIVEISIKQKVMTSIEENTNNLTWGGENNAGTHKVFLPSWNELTTVAGGTTSETLNTFLSGNQITGFWLKTCIWLRDTYKKRVIVVKTQNPFPNSSLFLAEPDYVQPTSVNPRFCVRPAFVLDLSKVDYTIK